MRILVFIFFEFFTLFTFAQFQVNWNTVNEEYLDVNPIKKVWIDEEGNTIILSSDEQTNIYLSKIDNAGSIYDTDYHYFVDTLILWDQQGYERDENDNIYIWGRASNLLYSLLNVLVKFDENLNLQWVYYYPDTIGLRSRSVFISNDTISVLTRSTYTFQYWLHDLNNNLLTVGSGKHGYYEGSFNWAAKNKDKVYISMEDDSLSFMIFDDQTNFLYKKVHNVSDTITKYTEFIGNHFFDSDDNMYYLSNRYNYATPEQRHVFKFSPDGDLIWERTRAFTEDLLFFVRSGIVEKNDGLLVYDIFKNEAEEHILYINNYTFDGDDLGNITINLSDYFQPEFGASVLFDQNLNRLYVYMPELPNMPENSGIVSFDNTGNFVFSDTLDIAYCFFVAAGIILHAPENKILLVNAKHVAGVDDNIEVTQLSDLSTGIVENKAVEKLQIHPNPVNDQLNIEFNDIYYAGKISCQILSTSGTICKTFQLSDIENGADLNVNDLNSGYYLIKLVGENSVYTGSFIKM